MVETNSNSSLSDWHKKMKNEKPQVYSQIQRKRWLNLMKTWKAPKGREKAVNSLKKRFGKDYFSYLGLKSAQKQKLTPREKLVKEKIDLLGFNIISHKTLSSVNVDFVYEKKGELKAIEEVLGFRKKKSLLFYEILKILEKYKKIRKTTKTPFFITTWYEVDLKYKTERFPLELLMWAHEKGLSPILMDVNSFEDVRSIRFESGEENDVIKYIEKNLGARKKLLKRGAKTQFKQPFDKNEKQIHNFFINLNLNPLGKKLLKTRYGTYIVTDNFLENNSNKIAVFVSKTDISSLVGSCALVKELVSSDIKTVAILMDEPNKKVQSKSHNILLKRYIDYFYNSLNELEETFVGW